MIKLISVIIVVVLSIDVYNVYTQTREINERINTEIINLKAQSLIGVYIQIPHIKDPFDAVIEIFQNLIFIMFMLVAYGMFRLLNILRLPFGVFF